LLTFGRDLSLTHLLVAIIGNIDRLLIGRFQGAGSVGIYRQAQQLVVIPLEQLNAPIMTVAQPGLSALQGEPERYRRYYQKILFLVTLGTLPLGLFTAVYAKEVTLLLLGPAWGEAAALIGIFAMGAAIRPAIATSAIVLITSGKSRRYLMIAVGHGFVLTLMLLVGVGWGAEGVAVAHVGTTVLLMVPKLYYSFLETPITMKTFISAVRTPAVAGMAMVGGLVIVRTLLPPQGVIVPLVLGAGVGGAVYLSACLLQREGKEQLRILMKDMVTGFTQPPGHRLADGDPR